MKGIPLVLIAALALALVGGASAQNGNGTVTVVHGVPGLTVDVYVNGDVTLQNFEPGTITDPLELPAGDYEIEIRPAGEAPDSDPAISGSASLEGGQNASIVAHLDGDGNPTLSVFGNDTSSVAAGDSRVSVRHTAAAPEVDVLANGDPLIEGLANADQQTASVPAGTYSIAVAPAGETDPVLGPTDLSLREGTIYAVYAFGSLEDENLDVLVQQIGSSPGSPAGVAAGTSGLVGDAFPVWVALLMTIGAALLAVSAVGFVRVRR
jgi:hypothetical protein